MFPVMYLIKFISNTNIRLLKYILREKIGQKVYTMQSVQHNTLYGDCKLLFMTAKMVLDYIYLAD